MSKEPEREQQDMPMGRIVFDERGNAMWQPATAVRSEQTLNRILQTDRLSLVEGEATGLRKVTAEDRYNPYRNGLPLREGERPRKKDLRALSEWVKMKKRLETGG